MHKDSTPVSDPQGGSTVGSSDTGNNAVEVEEPVVPDMLQHDVAPFVKGHTMPNDIFLQDVLIARFAITSGDTVGVNVATLMDPWRLYLTNTLIASRTRGFAWISGTMHITAVLTCPGSSLGAYVLGFVPEGGRTSATTLDRPSCDSLVTTCQVPNVILNCETQQSGELDLPFVWPQTAVNIDGPPATNLVYRIQLTPLSPLQSTIIASNISGTINLFARLTDDYKVQVRRYESKVSTKVKNLGSAVSAFSQIPVIGTMATAGGKGLAAVSSLMDSLGFTREAAPSLPNPMLMKLISNGATTDGEDGSNSLGLTSNPLISLDPTLVGGSSDDEMAFDYLHQKWNWVGNFNVTMATGIGVVQRTGVCPFYLTNSLVVGDGTANSTSVPFHLALPFTYWSGETEFRIYIPSSANIQGRLQVFYEPDSTRTDFAASGDPTVFNEGVMIDLASSSDTIIRVGMPPPTPFRIVGTTTLGAGGSAFTADYFSGQLVFYLTQALTSPKAAFSLPICVMVRGGPNLRYHVPKYFLGQRPFNQAIRYSFQSAKTVRVRNVSFCEASSPTLINEVFVPDQIDSCRALVQKFSGYGMANIYGEKAGTNTSPVFGMSLPLKLPIRNSSVENEQNAPFAPKTATFPYTFRLNNVLDNKFNVLWTWSAHYTSMFTGVRGSTRIKVSEFEQSNIANTRLSRLIIGSAPPDISSQMYYIAASVAGTAGATYDWFYGLFANLMFNGDIQLTGELGMVEALIPYNSPFKFVAPDWFNADTSSVGASGSFPRGSSGGVIMGFNSLPDDTPIAGTGTALQVFVAGGPDFAGVFFRRTPRIVFIAPPVN